MFTSQDFKDFAAQVVELYEKHDLPQDVLLRSVVPVLENKVQSLIELVNCESQMAKQERSSMSINLQEIKEQLSLGVTTAMRHVYVIVNLF